MTQTGRKLTVLDGIKAVAAGDPRAEAVLRGLVKFAPFIGCQRPQVTDDLLAHVGGISDVLARMSEMEVTGRRVCVLYWQGCQCNFVLLGIVLQLARVSKQFSRLVRRAALGKADCAKHVTTTPALSAEILLAELDGARWEFTIAELMTMMEKKEI